MPKIPIALLEEQILPLVQHYSNTNGSYYYSNDSGHTTTLRLAKQVIHLHLQMVEAAAQERVEKSN